MKLKMAENSLFAILLRSPWWISIAISVVVCLIAFAALPDRYAPYGAAGAFPFLVIGIIAAARQWRKPSAAQVAATLEGVRAMSWREFSAVIEDRFRSDGYTVTRIDHPAADFEIGRAGRTALLSCKRWKAASVGVEALRALHEEMRSRDAQESIYVTTGELTDNARQFATEHKVRCVQGADLAQLLGGTIAARKSRK